VDIRLKDLMRNSFRFLLDSEFRTFLFDKAIEKEGTIKNLAKKIGCSRDAVRIMRISQSL